MSISEFQARCYDNAVKLGWTEKVVSIPEMIALIHSEASEALEEFRNHKPISYEGEGGKPEGIASEFADIMIRIGHYASILGIDLQAECYKKLDYNLTRKYRHGGKEC